jgi:hypothetical protein
MTDRTLPLSIPDNNDAITEVKLQDILLDYFYNSIITGVKRKVDFDINLDNDVLENVASSPTVQTMMNQEVEKDEKYKLKQLLKQRPTPNGDSQVAVTAWQVLELLPFYSAVNEQGESIKTQVDASFPDSHLILPIVLKRYRFDQKTGDCTKMKKRVEIPVTIDFNKFVNQNADDPKCKICGDQVNWTLHFKSAVCHLGASPYSGHYISYARVNDDYWLKSDDMNSTSRITSIADKDASGIYNDMAENAYIVFYELDKTCHHPNNLAVQSDEDEDVKDDSKSTGSNSTHETDTEDINCQHETKKKKRTTKSKKSLAQHHRNHHHLKESCRIM